MDFGKNENEIVQDTQLAPSEVHQCRATERRHRIVAAILRDPARLLRHPRPSEEVQICNLGIKKGENLCTKD